MTRDFSPKGGGIDFLGLRWVNLTIVGRDLVPELNNRTSDMGTFFLGAWIPWKFRQLCERPDYTERNYKAFREKVEVALSLALREAGADPVASRARNRVGITQKLTLPNTLTFKAASRKEHNSLYAAPNYGPSLAYLGFIMSYRSPAKDGAKPLEIAIPGDDPDTLEILRHVNAGLQKSKAFPLLASLDSPKFTEKDVSQLVEAGLDPARYRLPPNSRAKACFCRKLLPTNAADPGYARTLTTRLLLATLARQKPLTADQARDTWYTGILPNHTRLHLTSPDLAGHAKRWSCFISRQYQRYALELFLWCFETAIKYGSRSVSDVIDHWADRAQNDGASFNRSFYDIMRDCAGPFLKEDDLKTSLAWNNQVHMDHERFEWVSDPQNDLAIEHGLTMLAGWCWRMLSRQQDNICAPLFKLGGADRMSISWLLEWLNGRRNQPIRDLLKDVFSDLIFAQHMRIALARSDGNAQRIRFLMGDSGIEPTISARKDFGELNLPWMPDRLDTLVALLCDCDVLANQDGRLAPGPAASAVK